jgi:hypothetical protein
MNRWSCHLNKSEIRNPKSQLRFHRRAKPERSSPLGVASAQLVVIFKPGVVAMRVDWVLLVLLAMLWLAAGGVPALNLRRRKKQ